MTPSKSRKKSKKIIFIEEALDSIIDSLGSKAQEKQIIKIKSILEKLWLNALHQSPGTNI